MANYGNILAVFNTDISTKNKIENILSTHQASFVLLNELFFLETSSKSNTRKILNELNTILDLEYLFYHNHISDGSQIKSKNMDADLTQKINKILIR